MSRQLSLDGPFPATPAERERAIQEAFGNDPAMIVSMRAGRNPCPHGPCKATPGEACSSPRRGGGRQWLSFPHPGRVALTVVCEEHGTAVGQLCPNWREEPCKTREGQVAPLLALNPAINRSTGVDKPVDTSGWPEQLYDEDEQGIYPLSPRALCAAGGSGGAGAGLDSVRPSGEELAPPG